MVSVLASRARGEYLRTHFKNMREVAAALTGMFRLPDKVLPPIEPCFGHSRHETTQSLLLPCRRQGAQASHSFPTVLWWRWTCEPGETIRDDPGCVHSRPFLPGETE